MGYGTAGLGCTCPNHRLCQPANAGTMSAMDISSVRQEFPGATGYLNSASIGLPPAGAVRELQDAVITWQEGKASAPSYDACVEDARRLFSRLVGASPESVAIGSQVSALIGLAATTLEPGARAIFPAQIITMCCLNKNWRTYMARKPHYCSHLPMSPTTPRSQLCKSLFQGWFSSQMRKITPQ